MEKLKQHKTIVKKLLSDLSEKLSKGIPDVRFEVLADEDKGQYLLFKDGWRGMHRMYGNVVHIEVKQDGKVWLHHDGTDLAIGQLLLDNGVDKSYLVLGFQAPGKRVDSGFAMA